MQKNSEVKKPFDFLKHGKDTQFDNAMKSIDNLYQNMFSDSQKYDQMFETFKTQNNPITDPIDEYTNQIFETEDKKQQKYVKIKANSQKTQKKPVYEDQEQSIVMGQPVYVQYSNQDYFQKNYKY